jgi:hypothetical protein|tara:strand:+ start:117 stop:293 length:177 start_codon:yes stop_codon:yes gene_type:complete
MTDMKPYEVLVKALTLAVDAPDEDRAMRATALAEALITDFGISEFEVRRAQREVERNG